MSDKREDIKKALDIYFQQETKHGRTITPDELHAYHEGTLTEEEQDRLIDRLVADESALRSLLDIDDFPGEEDAAEMAEGELETAWATFVQKVGEKEGRRPGHETHINRFTRIAIGLAACFLVAIGGLGYWVISLNSMIHTMNTPTLEASFSDVFLDEVIQRSEPDTSQTPKIERRVQTLGLHLSDTWQTYGAYTIEIYDPLGKPIFSGRGQMNEKNMLMLTLLRDFFPKPGLYKISVYGLANGQNRFLMDFDLEVPP